MQNAPTTAPVDTVTKSLEANADAKQAGEAASLAAAIEAAEQAVEKVEAEDAALLEGEPAEKPTKAGKGKKKTVPVPAPAEDPDEDEEPLAAADLDSDEEPEPEELKTRVFLKAKQRAQRERHAIENERAQFRKEQEKFQEERAQIQHEMKQVGGLKGALDRLFNGDDSAALELAQGRDLTQMWHALAAANDPNKRGQFQQKKEQTELEKKVDFILKQMEQQTQQAQHQSLAQQEKQLEQTAIESFADEESFPAIHKRYNVKNEWEKEELLLRYKTAAEELHAETGETPNHPSFFAKVSRKLEKKLRQLYLAGDSSKSSESDVSQAKSGQKPTSISASKMSARDSARKSVHEMTDEEKFAFAVRAAEEDVRRLEAEDE